MDWYHESLRQDDSFLDSSADPEAWTATFTAPSTRKPDQHTYGCEVKGKGREPVVQLRAFVLDHTTTPPTLLAEQTQSAEIGTGLYGDYHEPTRQAVVKLAIENGSI